MGVLSSACLDRLVSRRLGRRLDTYHAVAEEVTAAKEAGGVVGINIMVALQRDYEDSVRGALDAGVDAIIAGAGLPLTLPAIHPTRETALIPIVSSARALELICRKWERLGHRPDAVVLEGPLAGGHLGFRMEQLDLEENRLENLLPPVKEMAGRYGGFPVVVAGGIFTGEDIRRFLDLGADGVQMGTRFLATEESSATPEYKRAVVDATREDILVAHRPGSPCGLPFRVIRRSPMFLSALQGRRQPLCDKGYVLQKDDSGRFTRCPAKDDGQNFFCICNGLLSSAGYNPDREEPLYTVGDNARRVEKVMAVADLMDELASPPTRVADPS
jgi:nitronate monooxygenase